MSEDSGVLDAGSTWLLERWLERLTGVIESMTEEHPSMAWQMDGDDELGEGALILEQSFANAPEPMLWLGVPAAVHQDLGGRVLAIAGLETSEVEENRATCLEIIEQSLAGLAGAMNQRMAREISREQTKPCSFFPSGLAVIRVVASFSEKVFAPIWIAFSPALVSWIDAKPIEAKAPDGPVKENKLERSSPTNSRTFELLLDVALPVSVSFGKAELAVKEVLKLTTGSIVELNRSVSEPVDIIVNGCIIARGEVVVVEGNYGVRINNIVSRTERLRTGGAAVAESRARIAEG